MSSVNKFVKQFTGKEYLEATRIGRKYFEAKEELLNIKEKMMLQPHSIGLPLGEDTKKGFRPSLYLLERLSLDTSQKIFVNDKAEWLFLCGRDILSRSIVKDNSENEMCLVQNERDENLGLGKKIVKGKNVTIKNIFDRGDFLRREK
jgi:ribosome biogenesis protein Nip4